MKFVVSIILFLITQTLMAQTIISPSIETTEQSSLKINKIELTDYNTVLYCTHTSSDNYKKGGWVRFSPNAILKESDGVRSYKLLKAEGIPLDPEKFNYSYQGQTLSFRLFFQKVSKETKKVDLLECQTEGCFNFYGIELKKEIANTSRENIGENWGGRFLADSRLVSFEECV